MGQAFMDKALDLITIVFIVVVVGGYLFTGIVAHYIEARAKPHKQVKKEKCGHNKTS
jgi:phage shock protein PspC (stress-responsive transcriptional regulator)